MAFVLCLLNAWDLRPQAERTARHGRGETRAPELALSFAEGHSRLRPKRWDSSGFWRTWEKSRASRPLKRREEVCKSAFLLRAG